MKKALSVFMLFILLFSMVPESTEAATEETWKIKSTVSSLEIREKPSLNSKIIGKLKKDQTVPVEILNAFYNEEYNLRFHRIRYQGKKAYVVGKYTKEVKSNEKWFGAYGNAAASGSGLEVSLYIYKKTPSYIYFVSQMNEEISDSRRITKNYDGKAKLTKNNEAVFKNGSCSAKFKLVENEIHIKTNGKCFSLGLYDYVGGENELSNGSYIKR